MAPRTRHLSCDAPLHGPLQPPRQLLTLVNACRCLVGTERCGARPLMHPTYSRLSGHGSAPLPSGYGPPGTSPTPPMPKIVSNLSGVSSTAAESQPPPSTTLMRVLRQGVREVAICSRPPLMPPTPSDRCVQLLPTLDKCTQLEYTAHASPSMPQSSLSAVFAKDSPGRRLPACCFTGVVAPCLRLAPLG